MKSLVKRDPEQCTRQVGVRTRGLPNSTAKRGSCQAEIEL